MSKTNDTSSPTALEDYRPLADSELELVSGGTWGEFISSLWPHPAPANNHAHARGLRADM